MAIRKENFQLDIGNYRVKTQQLVSRQFLLSQHAISCSLTNLSDSTFSDVGGNSS